MVILQGEPIERASIHHIARLLQLLFPLGSWEFDLMGGWVGGCISSSNTIHSLLLNSSDSRCRLQGGVTHNTTRIWHRLQQYKNVLISSWATISFWFCFCCYCCCPSTFAPQNDAWALLLLLSGSNFVSAKRNLAFHPCLYTDI